MRNAIPKAHKGISKQQAFLAAFAACASVTRAAAAVKIQRGLHYRWLNDDPSYAPAFTQASLQAGQTLVDEGVRRAYQGITKAVYWQGEQVDTEFEWSDTLLMFLIKGFRPEYRESFKAEITGPGGGPIVLKNEALANLSDDDLANLIALTRKLAAASSDGSGVETPPAEPDL